MKEILKDYDVKMQKTVDAVSYTHLPPSLRR